MRFSKERSPFNEFTQRKAIAPNSTFTTLQKLQTGELPMLNQLTQSNKLPQLILTAGLCLTAVLASQPDRNAVKTPQTKLNGVSLNGASLNGTNLNGANLNGGFQNGTSFNGSGLGANGTNISGFELTSPTLTTAVLKEKSVRQIRLEGGQIALKIER
jgi:Pentapeptide repeats (8 copies)